MVAFDISVGEDIIVPRLISRRHDKNAERNVVAINGLSPVDSEYHSILKKDRNYETEEKESEARIKQQRNQASSPGNFCDKSLEADWSRLR